MHFSPHFENVYNTKYIETH